MTSNYNRTALEIDNRETVGNPEQSGFSNIFTNNPGVKGESTQEVKNIC